jgi:cystathionine beta-lyase
MLVEETLKQKLPKVKLVKPEGTYLLWLNFRGIDIDDAALNVKLINDAGLGLNAGNGFGKEGELFQRMNIACPRATVQLALDKLVASFGN